MRALRFRSLLAAGATAALLGAPVAARADVQITIVNTDGANEGFNDPAPATPVGGNTGTTVGQQRLIAFEKAAEIWSEILDSDVEIRVRASFDPLPCTASSGALGGAFPGSIVSHSPNAPVPDAWYANALANKLAGEDLNPAADDINAQFNSRIGEVGCLENSGWYYGLDGAHGDDFDLVSVLLHELGHGLGFLTYVDDSTGAEFANQPDVFESMILDTQSNKHWTDMTAAERAASAVNGIHLVWDGPTVRASVDQFLGPLVTLHVDTPAEIAGDLDFITANFGADVQEVSLAGDVAAALDAADPVVGPTTTDGCSLYDNSAEVAGKVALVDRGTCTFVVKAQNAQAAGAIGIIIVNLGDPLGGMDGEAPGVTIPVVGIESADGAALRANLDAGVHVRIGVDHRRKAGVGALNRPRLYAPNPVEPGSSVSHWDTSASPNLLMEPNLSGDLHHAVDMTLPLLYDLGWRTPTPVAPASRRGPAKIDPERAGPKTPERP